MQQKERDRAAMLEYLRSVGVNVSTLERNNLSDSEIEAIAIGIRRLMEKAKSMQSQDLS